MIQVFRISIILFTQALPQVSYRVVHSDMVKKRFKKTNYFLWRYSLIFKKTWSHFDINAHFSSKELGNNEKPQKMKVIWKSISNFLSIFTNVIFHDFIKKMSPHYKKIICLLSLFSRLEKTIAQWYTLYI